MKIFKSIQKAVCMLVVMAMMMSFVSVSAFAYAAEPIDGDSQFIEDTTAPETPEDDDTDIPEDDGGIIDPGDDGDTDIPEDDGGIIDPGDDGDDDPLIPDIPDIPTEPEEPDTPTIPDGPTDPEEGGEGDEPGEDNPPAETVTAVEVSSAAELETALENGEELIKIVADFVIDRTFYVAKDTNIYTESAHTLTRDPAFEGDVFVVGEDSNGTKSEAVLSLGGKSSNANDLLVINGNKENMAVSVTGSIIFVCGTGQADLYSNLTITNCKKIGNVRAADSKHGMSNTKYIGGAVGIVSANAEMNIYGGKYTDNSINTSGECIYGAAFYNFADMRVYGGLFENNSASRAGAFYNYRRLYIYNAVIRNNTAATNGGAIYLPASTGAVLYLGGENDVVESSVIFKNNSAKNGGAIGSAARIFAKDTVFEGNSASDEFGGAIYGWDNYNVMELENVEFNNNTAVYGGAVASKTKTTLSYDWGLKAKNVSFTGNTSSKSGAAVYVTAEVRCFFERCNFKENIAKTNGGAIFNSGAEIELDRVTLAENKGYHGAAIMLSENAKATLNGVVATGNIGSTSGNGGAINAANTTLNVYNSTFENNSSKAGSAIYMGSGTTGGIYKTNFIDNTCVDTNTSYAGALYICNAGLDAIVHSCKFTGNTSSGLGGAMTITAKTNAKLYNITAINNSASKGGVLYINNASTVVNIVGLTVSGNTATSSGPIIEGNTTNAKLNINKAAYKDLDVTGNLDAAYWSTAIANKLTVTETDAQVEGYIDYGNENMNTLWDSVDVKNIDELETSLNEGNKNVRVTADISVDRSLYVTSDTTLFTTDEFKLVRNENFTGDMFVVGAKSDGTLCEERVNFVLGNPTSNTGDLLSIDGNTESNNVSGSAVYVTGAGQVDVYSNLTFINNNNQGANPRNANINGYETIGGSVFMIAESGAVNIHGGLFKDNGKADNPLNGGAIYNNGTLNINGGTFDGNAAACGGAIYSASATNALGGTFKNNKAENGGAIYSSSALTSKDVSFEGNIALNGGAIYSERGNADINAVTLLKNTATEKGGAIYVAGGTFTSYDAVFSENKAAEGGALYVNDAEGINCTVTSNEFIKNTAEKAGAIYMKADGADINGSVFTENKATDGAAVYLDGCNDIMIISANATKNNASGKGGFIYAENADLTLKNSTVSNNTAEDGGAIALINVESAYINNNITEANMALSSGGAVYAEGSAGNVKISGGSYKANNAYEGGAVYIKESAVEVSGAKFTENIADIDGGVFYIDNSKNVVILDTEAVGNTADNNGGFITAVSSEFGMYGCSVKNNEAGRDGGAISIDNNTSSGIYTSVFDGNNAGRNGGVAIFASNGAENVMHSCTFENNTASKKAGVIYADSESDVKLYNSKMSNNSATTASIMYIDDKGTEVTVNGLTLSGNKVPLIWGADSAAVLNINKASVSDESGVINDAYWKSAIVNKLTVNDLSEDAPACPEYGNESTGNMIDVVSVSSSQELENAIKSGAKNIRIIADFDIDRTFYIASDVTIFSTTQRVLTRNAEFGGDIFVVGENEDGSNAVLKDKNVKLTLGNPMSETPDLLIIDGNKDNMTADVTGTVVFISNGSDVFFHSNLTIMNCHKVGNERTVNGNYSLSRPSRIGGAVSIIASGVLNIYGGTYKYNSVRDEDTSTEEGRNSTIGGVFYNASNLRIYDGLFDGNQAARGAIVYNYAIIKLLGGTYQNNYASNTGGVYYSSNSSVAHLLIGSFDSNGTSALFKNNSAKNHAGVAYTTVLNGCVVYGGAVFEGNKALNGNGGVFSSSSMVTAKNAVFKNNSAKGYGGVMYLSNSTDNYYTRFVNIVDCTFEANSAAYGGALALYASSADYPNGAIVTVTDSEFVANSSTGAGGVVFADRKSNLTINNSEFAENTAGGEAGVLYITGESNVYVTDSAFKDNKATNHGGAFSIRSSAFEMDNSTVSGNRSVKNGGAFYVSYISSRDVNSDVSIKNSYVYDNTASGSGGAMYVTRRDIEGDTHILTVVDTDFSGNTGDNGGGILLAAKSGAYFKDVTFADNYASHKEGLGGALTVYGGEVKADGVIFTKNSSKDLGGALYADNGAVVILNDISSSKNSANDKGGFAYTTSAHIKMYDSTIRSNTAGTGGAMYLYTDAGTEIYSTEFKDNKATAENGGALFVYTGSNVETIFNGNTFTGNSAANAGGALYVSGESNTRIYNTTAKDNSAAYGGFMYETKAGTVVDMSNIAVSGNTASAGGPIIWGNTYNAVLNLDKSTYKDLDVETEPDDAYWASAIANKLTVNDILIEVPDEDVYVGDGTATEQPYKPKNPSSVQDVFGLAQKSSDAYINSVYDKLPVLDNSSNFMSKQTTTFDNINGETVTVDTFVYPYRGQADNMNVGQGLLIYQAMLYKQAYPEEEVYIDVSSYRFSVDAAVNINRNSRYFGYMRNISGNYDQYGFVKIAYLLVSAAKMGIHVNVIGHAEGYPNVSTDTIESYFNSKLDLPCDPDYVTGGKVGDYLRATKCQWTLSSAGKGGTDMMHTKMCAVSHYLDMDGTPHKNAVFSSSSNTDGIRSDAQNGNWKLQTGTIISDHEEMYNASKNYIRLIADYSDQEGIIEFQDIVSTRSEKQIDLILEGKGNEIPRDEQIVYIGTETDDVFELYFTPLGGGRLEWSEKYNPYCKYIREMYESEDYIYFTWNAAEYSSYQFGRQMEEMISAAFHENRNPNNKIYVNAENFNTSLYDDLVVGEDIGFMSFNTRDFGDIHNKDVQFSYVKNGERYNVSLLNSCNVHGGSMYFQSNFCLVIKEKTCADDSVFSTIAKNSTKGDMTSHIFGEEIYVKPSETEHGNIHNECINCGYKQIKESYHNPGGWIIKKEATDEENGICVKYCTVCGELLETMENEQIIETEYKAALTTGKKFTSNPNDMSLFSARTTPRTFEATILVPKTVKDRAGVIVGNNGKADGKPINIEIYSNGHPKLFYMADGVRADIEFQTDIRSNDPVHIAITVDNSKATLYVNGKALESIRLPFEMPVSTANYAVGGDHRNGNSQYFKGTIYSVSLFNDVRTEEEIQQDMIFVPKTTDGLEYTEYFTDEEAITRISADSISGRTFNSKNTVATETVIDKAIASIETIIHIPLTQKDRAGVVFGNYNGTVENSAVNFEIFYNGAPRLFYVSDGVKYDVVFDTDIRSDKPVYLVITIDGNAANLYVDGVYAETKELPCDFPVINDSVDIGKDKRAELVPYFTGTLYTLNFYSDVMTEEEIKANTFFANVEDENLIEAFIITENDVMKASKGQTFDEKTMGHVDCVLPTTPKTFEAVISLPESVSGRGGIIVANNGGEDELINIEVYKEGKPRLYYVTNGITTDVVFNTDVRYNKPTHIAITVDGFIASLYVNGELKETVELGYALGNSTDNFVIGGDHRLGNNQYFKGNIYSVNLFDDVRTAEEIASDAILVLSDEEGLIYSASYLKEEPKVLTIDEMHPDQIFTAEYPLTETSSGLKCISCAHCGMLLTVDITPNDKGGTNNFDYNGALGLAAGDAHKVENALSAAPKTLELLINLPRLFDGRAGVMFGNYDGSTEDRINFEIFNNGCPRLWFKSGGVSYSYVFTTDIRSDKKTHIAFTIDGAHVSLYVDGVFKESISIESAYPESLEGYVVGSDRRTSDVHPFEGTIYAINVFDDVRTAEEIKVDTYGVASNTKGLMYSKYFQYDLKGKTIVNFGDSIFGNYKAPVDISTFISNQTKATVYNVGFGSAQMSENSTEKYEPFGMQNLADAITTGDWTAQEAIINSGIAPVAYNRCFPTLKSIDFNNVDIITIAYGTNDFKNGKSLAEVENAIRYSIETILNTYPDVDIVLCTPVYRYWIDEDGTFAEDSNTKEINGIKLTDYVELYKEIGDEYGLVVIDNYNGSGINASTRAECFTGTDTTHPNETGRQKIADYMSQELCKCFN